MTKLYALSTIESKKVAAILVRLNIGYTYCPLVGGMYVPGDGAIAFGRFELTRVNGSDRATVIDEALKHANITVRIVP